MGTGLLTQMIKLIEALQILDPNTTTFPIGMEPVLEIAMTRLSIQR